MHLVRVEAFFMGLNNILDIFSECLSWQSYCFWLEHSTVNLKVEELRLGHYSELLATRPNAVSNLIVNLILLLEKLRGQVQYLVQRSHSLVGQSVVDNNLVVLAKMA